MGNTVILVPKTAPVSFFELHFQYSKKLLRQHINDYNAQQQGPGALKLKLRAAHIQLAEYLFQLYGGMLRGQQRSSSSNLAEGILPVLKTSNGALAKQLGTCKATIINLRKRLVAANIIAYKKWHGSNAAYELELNAKCLFLRDPKGQLNANLNDLFFGAQTKTFDHTVSGTQYPEYPDQDTKKERNKKGEATAPIVENSAQADVAAVPSSANIQETGSGYDANVTDSASSRKGENQDTQPPKLRAVPPFANTQGAVSQGLPERLPATMDEAIGFLSPENQTKVRYAAGMCWSKALASIYKDEWLTDRQKEAGMIALAEYIARSVHPKRYDAARGEIQERLDMVFEWVNDKRGRFVLLPRYYFDLRNQKNGGFSATERWLKKKQVRNFRRARRTAITKAVNTYLKALQPNSEVDRQELHHQLTQTLRKKYGAKIVAIFEDRIDQAILNMK
ncbi:hypothetical protein [Lewinella cohaerens]|uniref:hypothetical protein n=1 Tax=Lewinella cohaerens TaxID=70995 RepID=UPI00036D80FC|nr:hypothetical protein [Lewinella cohaerens]